MTWTTIYSPTRGKPRSLTLSEYRRARNVDLHGTRCRAARDLKNAYGVIAKGSIVTIVRKFRGLTIESSSRARFGAVRIPRIQLSDLIVLDPIFRRS